MMLYIVNKNAQIRTGEHKVHTNECKKKPKYENIRELGKFCDSQRAICEAIKYYSVVDSCKYCCKEIHLKK